MYNNIIIKIKYIFKKKFIVVRMDLDFVLLVGDIG